MKTRIVSFRMGLEEIAAIDQIATAFGLSRNQLVRDLVLKAIKNEIKGRDRGGLQGLTVR